MVANKRNQTIFMIKIVYGLKSTAIVLVNQTSSLKWVMKCFISACAAGLFKHIYFTHTLVKKPFNNGILQVLNRSKNCIFVCLSQKIKLKENFILSHDIWMIGFSTVF